MGAPAQLWLAIAATVSVAVGTVLYLRYISTGAEAAAHAAADAGERGEERDEQGAQRVEGDSLGREEDAPDLSKLAPHKLLELLDSDPVTAIAALRGLMAQSAISALQDATRAMGGLERVCAVARAGTGAQRVLALEIVANYAPRPENHVVINNCALDVMLRDLHRAAAKGASVVDTALGAAGARALLNISATDGGAALVCRVDVLRALLDHAADRRGTLRLPCLKVLRNVAVAELPRDAVSCLRSTVGRSQLATDSTARLRVTAAQGDEAASLTLSVLDKARTSSLYPQTPERAPAASARSDARESAQEDVPSAPTPARDAPPFPRLRTADMYASLAGRMPSMADEEGEGARPSRLGLAGVESTDGAVPRGGGVWPLTSPPPPTARASTATSSTVSSSAKVRRGGVDAKSVDGGWDGGDGASAVSTSTSSSARSRRDVWSKLKSSSRQLGGGRG